MNKREIYVVWIYMRFKQARLCLFSMDLFIAITNKIKRNYLILSIFKLSIWLEDNKAVGREG